MIDTAVTVSVCPDEDYYYDIKVSDDELAVFVHNKKGETTQQINFGSNDEMRAVAKAINNALSMRL